jgi:hypothetical protein
MLLLLALLFRNLPLLAHSSYYVEVLLRYFLMAAVVVWLLFLLLLQKWEYEADAGMFELEEDEEVGMLPRIQFVVAVVEEEQ